MRRNVTEIPCARAGHRRGDRYTVFVPLLEATRTLPIVFVLVSDPVGGGFVESLARPGGNVTGFTQIEYGMGVKWLELLKQVAPGVTRVAVLRDPTVPSGIGQFGAIQARRAVVRRRGRADRRARRRRPRAHDRGVRPQPKRRADRHDRRVDDLASRP